MKLIEAVVQKMKLDEVRGALAKVGVAEFMESAVICHGAGGRVMRFRGAEFVTNLAEKVKLEVVSADDAADKIVGAIRAAVADGRREDCRIDMRPYLEVT
jgi:nitrogen regulatory protein P-II 1